MGRRIVRIRYKNGKIDQYPVRHDVEDYGDASHLCRTILKHDSSIAEVKVYLLEVSKTAEPDLRKL
jgi:hypothetical protein